MAEFKEAVVRQSPPGVVSLTAVEAGESLQPYVWDTANPPKDDPFFAVPHFVVSAPKTSLIGEDEIKVFLTF